MPVLNKRFCLPYHPDQILEVVESNRSNVLKSLVTKIPALSAPPTTGTRKERQKSVTTMAAGRMSGF